MTRPALRFAMLLAAPIAAWQPSIAQAAEEDVQLWHIVNFAHDLDDDTRLTVDASQRWREAARGGDQQTLRFQIEQAVAKGVRIGGGAMVLDAGGVTELRPHQQVTFVLGRFEARTRLEQRFIEGADQTELRLRQRLQINLPLGKDWRGNLAGEWLGLLRSRNAEEGASTEQWRAQVGLAYKINARVELGANYWLLAFPNRDQPRRISHVPQTTLSYRF